MSCPESRRSAGRERTSRIFRRRAAFRLRPFVQCVCLALFLALLAFCVGGGERPLDADLFLSLDPLAGLLSAVTAREMPGALAGALFVLFSALLAGRVFCGWICPMGTTLEFAGNGLRALSQRITGRLYTGGRRPLSGGLDTGRGILLACAAAAVAGVNLYHWFSPIPWVTRLYALCVLPLVRGAANLGLDAAAALGLDVGHFAVDDRAFATAGFVALVWLVLLVLELVRPRFWCRWLCPAGALLGLLARGAPVRRSVSGCTHCGRCARVCPVDLPGEPRGSDVAHCLSCGDCAAVCPGGHISFTFSGGERTGAAEAGSCEGHDGGDNERREGRPASPLRSGKRRAFLGSALCAATGAALAPLLPSVPARAFVRPPGALPEERFLDLCLRCGACVQACPTGGLQPLGVAGGPSALFTPVLVGRRGACVVECTRCGGVCPTGAVASLAPGEKRWAKMGTARVDRTACLALAEGRRCVVCKENCPYGAIDLVPGKEEDDSPAPEVRGNRCFGCGFCERACPKEPSAIVVVADGALRLDTRDYGRRARALGLELDPARHAGRGGEKVFDPSDPGPPPGFLE